MCIACSPFGSALAAAASRRAVMDGMGRLAMGAGAVGFGSLLRCAEAQTPPNPSGAADAIWSGGPILTMNDAAPSAEAVAVRGGRILAVGTRAQVEATRGPGTRMMDLANRTMLPGFVDPHGHVVMVGLQAVGANMLAAPDGEGNDIPALVRILREWAQRNAAAARRYNLIFGFGYDDSQLREQRHPTREELDQVSTDVPVLIIHTSSHLAAANSKALEVAGITAATPDPVGGVFRRRDGSREPNGVMEENAMLAVAGPLLGRLDEAAWLSMIRAGSEFYASFGYTTCQEGRAMGPALANLSKAAERGLLAVDVVAYPDILGAADQLGGALQGRAYRSRLRVGGAKISLDGSPQGKTAWLTRPYLVPPAGAAADYRGLQTAPTDATIEAFSRCYERGWQIMAHANGDAAIDLMIAAAREATRRHGPGDRRPVLIHGQTLREDQVDQLRDLGIFPALFPMHTFYWGDWHRDSVLGPERAENISPTGWLMSRGMMFTSHHDAPVARPDSMRVLSATVTRRSRTGDIIGPRHRVPVGTALKAMTLWAAHQHFEEASKGSIEVGKLADFVVLSDNPMTVDPETLATLKVTETIKEGASVFRA
ncbi:amidohydrolase [Roseomonas sp. CECT 9278]|uniref:amidohydrolase n=1 Tax=Roseomonas sp. CECT 9278 TaxID=2845823 RepID=UPI001E51E5A0|nr:amidohydrolase [Roseomonas sp. CECT 9278]CAH0147748.1 N-substituted formamide deformylase [Roseomonas sp. CECT 9278]